MLKIIVTTILQVSRRGPGGVSAPRGPALHVLTPSSKAILQWWGQYGTLVPLLSHKAEDIYLSICDLFEIYFLHIFISCSGVTIDQFAAEDDIGKLMTRRLQ